MGDPSAAYRLDLWVDLKNHLRALLAKANAVGRGHTIYALLTEIFHESRAKPEEMGDPHFDTQTSGGTVYQGYRDCLIVRYAVFETRRVVIILSVKPHPDDPLAK